MSGVCQKRIGKGNKRPNQNSIELIMEYAPQPPYGTGRPDLADAQTLAAARAAMQQAMTGVPA